MFTELLKERDSINGTIPVQSLNGTYATSGAIDMSRGARCEIIGMLGTMVAGGNVTCILQETDNANGSSPTTIAMAGNTTGNMGSGSANTPFTLEINATQMTKRYLVFVLGEVSSKASIVGAVAVLTCARFGPINNCDITMASRTVVG